MGIRIGAEVLGGEVDVAFAFVAACHGAVCYRHVCARNLRSGAVTPDDGVHDAAAVGLDIYTGRVVDNVTVDDACPIAQVDSRRVVCHEAVVHHRIVEIDSAVVFVDDAVADCRRYRHDAV